MAIGILAAMHDEIGALLRDMDGKTEVRTIGMRDYHVGTLWGRECVVVLARLGKVAAAATATTLIRDFGVSEVLFTGLAGGVGMEVKVGDVVIADRLVQHDMDCRPFFPRHSIPLLDISHFPAEARLVSQLQRATQAFLRDDLPAVIPAATLARFGVRAPDTHTGLIASGDRFINHPDEVATLRADLPGTLAVEMEGAAVAQVCHEYGVPCAVLRTISDRADANAHVDFIAFLREIASVYSHGIMRRLLHAS